MKPFLQSIAEAYAANESAEALSKMIFIFPNKRSATFFNHYLAGVAARKGPDGESRPLIHPDTVSIVQFAEMFAQGAAQADRLEMVFMLYDVYREVVRRHNGESDAARVDFNKFVFWADTLIQDFDDVDNALADPAEVFRNVSTLKEISANYLTQEQADEIRRYWRDFDLQPDEMRFWNHLTDAGQAEAPGGKDHTSVSAGFLRLWQVMGEVYTSFRAMLRKKGLYTSGMNFRDAAAALAKVSAGDIPYSRYIFVGFNNLSVAESTIFKRLSALTDPETGLPMADFYWDTASQAFAYRDIPGIERVRRYAETFPSLYRCIEPLTEFPKIYLVGVPSRIGQCKAIGHALGRLFPPEEEHEGLADPAMLRRTALVLPDEQLLTPLVNSLPAAISPVNLTMGYKLRNTSVASLMRAIVSLQLRAYRSRNAAATFFIDDVTRVLTHPLVRAVSTDTVDATLALIRKERLFNVPEAFFRREEFEVFAPIFTMVADKQSCSDVFTYLTGLLGWLDRSLTTSWRRFIPDEKKSEASEGDDDATDADAGDSAVRLTPFCSSDRSVALQQAFVRRYANAVARLQHLRDLYLQGADGQARVYLEDATVFNLVERIISGEMLNFEGVPLEGLQVMGILEARALDFDTLLIPSMNERIFPRSKFSPSFIPELLRRSYRLSTAEDQEGAFIYFFYRMISRARQVHLLYDARTSGSHASEPSRFIQQLLRIFQPKDISSIVLPYRLASFDRPMISVSKTPATMEILRRYFSEEDPLYLSASSIEKLLGCPVSFYLEKIAGYKESKDLVDWMDEGTYGEVVHRVFETLYNELLAHTVGGEGVVITAQLIEAMIKDTPLLERHIRRAINELYLKLDPDRLDAPLTGDCLILGKIIIILVQSSLRRELDFTPFIYRAGEWSRKMRLTIKDGEGESRTFNLNLKIDRIDRLADPHDYPRLRVVDYKTGGDSTSATTVCSIFGDYKTKAFLQLMIYCQAYAQEERYHGPIQPLIYPVRRSPVEPYAPLKWSEPADGEAVERADLKAPKGNEKKWRVLDYRDYREEFNSRLIETLDDLLDPDVPFAAPADNDACKYCDFLDICRREIPF